jgi:hypothetical protein
MRVLLATSALSLALSSSAWASGPVCGDRDEIVADLAAKYDETVQSVGLASGGNLLEILASSQGTWSALFTTPAGVTCIVAYGEAWEPVAKPPAEA